MIASGARKKIASQTTPGSDEDEPGDPLATGAAGRRSRSAATTGAAAASAGVDGDAT